MLLETKLKIEKREIDVLQLIEWTLFVSFLKF